MTTTIDELQNKVAPQKTDARLVKKLNRDLSRLGHPECTTDATNYRHV